MTTFLIACGWTLVAAEVLRSVCCALMAVLGRSLPVAVNGYAAYALVREDVCRWRVVAGIEAIHHGVLAIVLSITLVIPYAPWAKDVIRFSLAPVAVFAVLAMARALWSTHRHAHIYRALKRGLRPHDYVI